MKTIKMVGAYVPLPISNYLEIYAFATKQSKSKVIRDILFEFANFDEIDKLESIIAQDIQTAWLRSKQSNMMITYEDFVKKEKMKLALFLPAESIERVLIKVLP